MTTSTTTQGDESTTTQTFVFDRTPQPAQLDAYLAVLKRHGVAVFRSDAFSVEFDPNVGLGKPSGDEPPAERPGDEATDEEKRAYAARMYRSSGG